MLRHSPAAAGNVARARRRAAQVLAVTVAGFAVTVAVCAWLASRPDVVDLYWGLICHRGQDRPVQEYVARDHLVLAGALATLPAVAAAAWGVYRSRRVTPPVTALPAVSVLGGLWLAFAAPNVLGCFLVSYFTHDPDLLAWPSVWPGLLVASAAAVAVAWALWLNTGSRRRGR